MAGEHLLLVIGNQPFHTGPAGCAHAMGTDTVKGG